MPDTVTPLHGYIRADIPLKVLETDIVDVASSPGNGLLEILTEDGTLRLIISGDAADDLLIDLHQFLERERSAGR